MIQKIFKHNDKCYKLKPIVTICPSGISMRWDKDMNYI
jgi:hypothetical protein